MQRLGQDELQGAIDLSVAGHHSAVDVLDALVLRVLGGDDNFGRVAHYLGVVGERCYHFARKLGTLRVVDHVF